MTIYNFALIVALDEMSGDHQVFRIYPLWTMNVSIMYHSSPFNSSQDIYVKEKDFQMVGGIRE